MYLTPQERREQMVGDIIFEQRTSILAAAYTVYMQLTSNNKKPISQRQFHREFNDNWDAFSNLLSEELQCNRED